MFLLGLRSLKQDVEFLSKHSLRRHADHVIHKLPIPEEQQGWSRTDTVLCGNPGIVVNIQFGHPELPFTISRQFRDYRSHHMTGTTPVGREDHQDRPWLLEHLGFEVLIC